MSERARFRRSRGDRLVAGVAGGLARDMGASPGVVRLGFFLLAWLYLIGPILYVALWIAMPAEPEPSTEPVEGPTGRALRRTEGGIRLARRALGVVAGLVGLAQVAIPLARDVTTLRGLLARADSVATPAGAEVMALVPEAERGGDPAPPRSAPSPLHVAGPSGESNGAAATAATAPISAPALLVPDVRPIDPTERDAPALRALVDLAGRVETAALASLDESALASVFVGEALQAELQAVAELRAAGAVRTQRLLARDVLRVASDGSAGVVEMVERWRMELRSPLTGECVAFPDHAVPQTVHLARTADGWRVARIDFHDATPAVPQPCPG